ncbi:MAG: ATP-binding protein [Rhodospirillaceae bacterium]
MVRDAADRGETVFTPLALAKPTNVFVIFAARARLTQQGQWAGIVNVTLEIKIFNALLASMRPADTSSTVVLVGLDGRIISRAPDPDRFVGVNIAKGGHFELHMASGQKLTFHRLPSLTDHIERISAVRTIANGAFVVIVSKSVTEALTRWRSRAINQGIGSIVLSMAVLWLTALAVRHHRREGLATALAETALVARQASEERLSLATAGTHIGIWDYNVATDSCVYDAEMMRLYGLHGDGGGMTLERWQAAVYVDDRARATGEVLAALGGERTLDTEFRIVWPDETIHQIRSMAQVYRDQSSNPIRMVRINYDITERKHLEDSLREKMRELNIILENSSVGITFVKDRKQVWANNRMATLFGYRQEEMEHKSTRTFYVSQEDYDLTGLRAYAALGRGDIYRTEQKMLRHDGSHIWVRMCGKSITCEDSTGGSIWTFEDITDQKRLEFELRVAKEDADAANRSKSEFLAMMSHEIRTPITGVLGMADLLRRTPLNDEQVGYLDTLGTSTKTLLTVLNDILDISKIEAGKIVFEAAEFDLHRAVIDTIAMFMGSAVVKNLALVHDFAEDLPRWVIGDQARFKQLLFNLTSNAIKFTAHGGVCIRASVKSYNGALINLLLEVDDTGMGIAPDQLAMLFKPFTQLGASTTRCFGGTGLGLVITKRLVEMMGGSIGVDSQLEKGTRFWFSLPLQLAPSRATVTADDATPSVPIVVKSLRILLAEDNRINQMLVRTMLQKMGHTVVVADNGRIAVDTVAAGDFDVVLMDMQMPEMDGEEATRVIRGQCHQIKPYFYL